MVTDPPIRMSNHLQAVLMGDKIYIGGGYATSEEDAATIVAFDSRAKTWERLPRCPTKNFGLVVIPNRELLAVVAGTDATKNKTGKVYVLDPNSAEREWNLFPCTSMLNYRSSPSVVSYDKWLIAVGGEGRDGKIIDCVEKLDTTADEITCNWTNCAVLATKSTQFSITVVKDRLYAFCTNTKLPMYSTAMPSNTAYFAEMNDLLRSQVTTQADEVWHSLKPAVPIKSANVLTFQRSLYALGGFESAKVINSCIYRYEPDIENEGQSSKWIKVSDMPRTVYQCACTELNDGIFVYGKYFNQPGACAFTYGLRRLL